MIFSLNENVQVKRVQLKLTGKFKLEFLQVGGSGVSGIVKEQRVIFECVWDNLLCCAEGEILENLYGNSSASGDSSNNNGYTNSGNRARSRSRSGSNGNNSGSGSSSSGSRTRDKLRESGLKMKFRIKNSSSQVLELPDGGVSGTPFEGLFENGQTGGGTREQGVDKERENVNYSFMLKKGNYELPFRVELPNDIPETVEGLQSGSILYSFEAKIERRKRNGILSETDMKNLNALLIVGSADSYYPGVHGHSRSFVKYKYLRILRTLSPDNMALQEEMKVGNSWRNKLQYEIAIPSRAIPIGGKTPVSIKIFPFHKFYRLERIGVALVQVYTMKDSDGQLYGDEVTVNRQEMTDFGDLVERGTNRLVDKVELNSEIKLPDNLKTVTQDCDLRNDCIHVHHKLAFHIVMKNTENNQSKNLEIKASIPVLLFVSPQVPMKGRLVLLEEHTGRIHFRPGKLVSLFYENSSNGGSVFLQNPLGGPGVGGIVRAPPPVYQERMQDRLVQHLNSGTPPYINAPPGGGNGSEFGAITNDDRGLSNSATRDDPTLGTIVRKKKALKFKNINEVPSYDDTVNSIITNPNFDVETITSNGSRRVVVRCTPSYSAVPSSDLSPAYTEHG